MALAACVGGGEPEVAVRAFRGGTEPAAAATGDSPAPVDAAAASPAPAAEPAVAAGAEPPVADESDLREELASAADPTAAALELAAGLAGAERVHEALAVVDTALARVRNDVLRATRAGLLRDLGQRHAAVAELRSLRHDVGAAAMAPELLFALAELEWLEGDAAASAATQRQLTAAHARHPWMAANRAARDALAAEVARGGRPTRLQLRDLLGNLRGAPLATERIAVLELLHRSPRTATAAHDAVRERAIAIAVGDVSPAVRTRAVQLATPARDQYAEFCAGAFADPEPLVRRAALARTVELLGADARPLLLACLAVEQDPPTFVAVHDALAALAGVSEPLDEGAAATAAARAEIVARWRARPFP